MSEQNMQSSVEKVILNSYEAMYRLAYCYVRNEQDAMDIVQESVYKCIRGSGKIRKTEYIKTWVWRVVINTAIDWKQKQGNLVTLDILKNQGTEDNYRNMDIDNALNSLKETERGIIILYYFEGFKLEEISEIMKMKLSTVKSSLYRSLKKLRKKLSEGDVHYEEA